jgi:hypothetical protein
MLINYHNRFKTRGKFIYEPTQGCIRRGEQVIRFIERSVKFPDYFYHFASGGHVAALHAHIANKLFFKIDIQNFFYSIARNRIQRALASWGMAGAPTFAAWSVVRSPYPTGPKFVLPIGFVQSPHLASLVLLQSPLIEAIEAVRAKGVLVSVYLDDIVGSHTDLALLTEAYEAILAACVKANFVANPKKVTAPSEAIVAFNCDVTHQSAEVTDERMAKFYSTFPSMTSRMSFEEYVDRVAQLNGR